MSPRSGRYGCAAGRTRSPMKARRRSIRATSREPSRASTKKSTPMSARMSVKPVETRPAITTNAPTPMNRPRAIAVLAYQVAGWIGDSRNARMGSRPRRANAKRPPVASSPAPEERSIPDRANDAPPGIRADTSPARISSSPAARTTAPITTPWARAERRSRPGRPRCRSRPPVRRRSRHPAPARTGRAGPACRTGSVRAR